MSKPTVTWFSGNHEHRLHCIKLGLMRLARRGIIRFVEIPEHAGNLAPHIARHLPRKGLAFVKILSNAHEKTVMLDGEDSIFQISPLIEFCDYYFICSYHRRFFENAPFAMTLPWQEESEVAHYRKLYDDLQTQYQLHLDKARPLIPLGPEGMEFSRSKSWLLQRVHNAKYRSRKLFTRTIDWAHQYESFEMRWNQLLKLREMPIKYDVVLKDSLWGWPRHRIALHQKLASLSSRYDIRSELKYRTPEAYELGHYDAPDPSLFPMIVGDGFPDNYEQMLASSRLGVFATGFHWGSRGIVVLAWFLGLPVYMDPPVYESIYDFKALNTNYNSTGDWRDLEEHLQAASLDKAGEVRRSMQKTFDRIASPEVAANYILSTVLG